LIRNIQSASGQVATDWRKLRLRTLQPRGASSLTPPDFIIALFSAVAQEMLDLPQHPEAQLSPSAVVTRARLCASKGGSTRAFSRGLTRDSLPLFPQVPERTRLARLCQTQTAWTTRVLAVPTVWGVAATSGIALLPPMRDGRRPAQIGQQGQSNHRWIVGGKLGVILHQWGVSCAWDCATANGHAPHFQPLLAPCEGQMLGLADTGFHAKTGDPAHLQVCPRGPWNTRLLVETVWSMLTTVFQSTKVGHRVWASFRARLAWTMVALNLLARWGMEIDAQAMVHLSIAEFGL
jgi:hypothetical protein